MPRSSAEKAPAQKPAPKARPKKAPAKKVPTKAQGDLATAAEEGNAERVEQLLNAGVDPNVWTGDPHAPRYALSTVFLRMLATPTIDRIVKALLAHGASGDLATMQMNELVTAVSAATTGRCSEKTFLAIASKSSERTRAGALVDLLTHVADVRKVKARVAVLVKLCSPTSDARGGLTPFHAAAAAGGVALVRSFAKHATPRTTSVIHQRVGWFAMIRIARGATPLGAALATRDQLRADSARGGLNGWYTEWVEEHLRRLDGMIALLEKTKMTDGREDDSDPPQTPFERVLAGFLMLAESVGNGTFAELAERVAPTGKGPVNALDEFRKLLQPALDQTTRERFERTLLGMCVTGAIETPPVAIRGEREEFEEEYGASSGDIADENVIDPAQYPEKIRGLFWRKPANFRIMGGAGRTILAFQKQTSGTTIFVATPEKLEEHDALTWITTGLAELTIP